VGRIVRRRERIEAMVMEMLPEDRDRITAAICAVEARTMGEIVCVLAEQSVGSGALPILSPRSSLWRRRGFLSPSPCCRR
jgi:hypothetical protein